MISRRRRSSNKLVLSSFFPHLSRRRPTKTATGCDFYSCNSKFSNGHPLHPAYTPSPTRCIGQPQWSRNVLVGGDSSLLDASRRRNGSKMLFSTRLSAVKWVNAGGYDDAAVSKRFYSTDEGKGKDAENGPPPLPSNTKEKVSEVKDETGGSDTANLRDAGSNDKKKLDENKNSSSSSCSTQTITTRHSDVHPKTETAMNNEIPHSVEQPKKQQHYVPPPPSQQAKEIASLIEKNPELLVPVVETLKAHHRRKLIVAGTTMEWYDAKEISSQIREADIDGDLVIGAKDYYSHIGQSFFHRKSKKGEAGGVGGKKKKGTSPGDMKKGRVPYWAFFLIGLHAACPFVAYGWMDNTIMLLSGDMIGTFLGEPLGLSIMASAALGGIVSGTMGIQFHGLAERLVELFLFRPPPLPVSQASPSAVFRAAHLGGTLGILFGGILGMWPLIFLKRYTPTTKDPLEDLPHAANKAQQEIHEMNIVNVGS